MKKTIKRNSLKYLWIWKCLVFVFMLSACGDSNIINQEYSDNKLSDSKLVADNQLPEEDYFSIVAMQYNVRVWSLSDGSNNWPNRKSTAAAFIQAMDADIIGTQEMGKTLLVYNQYNELMSLLSSDYEGYVGYRQETITDEGLAIIYKKNRFTLMNSGKFWLSETPDIKSKGWDAGYHRIAVWAILKENTTNQEIFVINTHFDNSRNTARNESALLILDKINTLSEDRPVIMTGDLNTIPTSVPVNRLKTELDHTKDVAIVTSGPNYTINDYSDNPPANVFFDYIFTSKDIGTINKHIVSDAKYNGIFLSDHNAVIAEIDIYYNPEQ